MAGFVCPSDPTLQAWLKDPPDDQRDPALTAHLDACPLCQDRLERLDRSELRRLAAGAGGDLLDDLRRQPPADELEGEPECARAITLVEQAVPAAGPPVNLKDVEALARLGHYEVLSVLGLGGMGVVYKARNLRLDRLVAIKVLPRRKAQAPGDVARFDREMKAIAQLSHPHIVMAYDADEADGQHYLVMEYIDGTDLKSLVKAQGPLPVAKAVDYVVQAARGLSHAHEKGLVHRDVKPGNLMLDRTGTVKLLDLGLAWSGRGGQDELTETGMVVGTVDYMAPEQAASARDIDGRADIYSLGCSLYHLLTGLPPYPGNTVIQKVLAHRDNPIPSLRSACPECPASLDRVFQRMVAKRPDDRYSTMAELLAELEAPSSPPSSATEVMAIASPVTTASPPVWRGWTVRANRRRAGIAVGLALLATGALLLPFIGEGLRRQPGDGPPRPKAGGQAKAGGPAHGGGVPQGAEDIRPGRWNDLLPRIPVIWPWKKTADGLFQPPEAENAVVQVPVNIGGSYRLRTSFTRKRGSRSVNYYFPVGEKIGILYLDIDDVNSLVIDGEHGPSSPVRSALMPLVSGRRYEVTIEVTVQGQGATIAVALDGKPHLRWTGAQSRLSAFTSSGRFALGSRDGNTVYHSLQLWPIDGLGDGM